MEAKAKQIIKLKDIPDMPIEEDPWKGFNFASGLSNGTFEKSVSRLQLDLLGNTTHKSLSLKKYSRDQITSWLQNPELNAKMLREASVYLYEVSPQYRRLITYFSELVTLDYIVVPYKLDTTKADPKKTQLAYKKSCDWLQVLNIKHELLRILATAYREDVFYGYLLCEKDSAHIQKLNPDYCKISSVVDSTFICAFDFSYFDSRQEELSAFSSEFVEKYEAYKGDGTLKWQELDVNKQFCIKITDSIYPAPILPFGGVLEYIYRILDYADLQQTREELENYKILVMKVPLNSEQQLSLDKNLICDFYDNVCNELPSAVGAVISPCDIQDIAFDRSNAADSDLTESATTDFWNASGVSSLLFGGKQSAASLNISIKADIALAMGVVRQVERVLNRLLKTNVSGTQKFQVNFLQVTPFTQKEMNELYIKNAQYGLPTKMMAAATTGQTPSDIVGLTYLENSCLNLNEQWVPLQSSHTASAVGTSTGGRPSDTEENMTDPTEKAQSYK